MSEDPSMNHSGNNSEDDLVSLEDRIAALLAHHRDHTSVPAQLFQAPGRVNLLGEHTDYSGGFCMPAALNFNTLVAASPLAASPADSGGPAHTLRLHSLDFHESVDIDLTALAPPGRSHWSSYPAGVAWSLQQRGFAIPAADLTFTGNVPLGSGLSSSASIEVATATALLALARATLPPVQVAVACQNAENNFVGAPSGIMDQYISACGVRGNALAIDTRALTHQLAPIPANLRLVIANTMVKHDVAAGGEYAKVRREVEAAAAALHQLNPAIHQLRDATLLDLEAGQSHMSHESFLRARHVITDSQRVLDGVAALRAGDQRRFGTLMTDAHASFRDDFGASCDRCDLLVRLAISLPGCLGSRLTGGGFGGCTVSLVEATAADAFAQSLQRLYHEAVNVTAPIFICQAEDGAGPLPAQ